MIEKIRTEPDDAILKGDEFLHLAHPGKRLLNEGEGAGLVASGGASLELEHGDTASHGRIRLVVFVALGGEEFGGFGVRTCAHLAGAKEDERLVASPLGVAALLIKFAECGLGCFPIRELHCDDATDESELFAERFREAGERESGIHGGLRFRIFAGADEAQRQERAHRGDDLDDLVVLAIIRNECLEDRLRLSKLPPEKRFPPHLKPFLVGRLLRLLRPHDHIAYCRPGRRRPTEHQRADPWER